MKHAPNIVRYIAVLALTLFAFSLGGCASAPAVNNAIAPARDMIENWNLAREDGKLTPAEVQQHDVDVRTVARSMDNLESAVAKSYPPLDSPTDPARWYEWAAGALGLLSVGTGTYMKAKKDINNERDAQREVLGEDIVAPAARVAAARTRVLKPKPALIVTKKTVGEHPTT